MPHNWIGLVRENWAAIKLFNVPLNTLLVIPETVFSVNFLAARWRSGYRRVARDPRAHGFDAWPLCAPGRSCGLAASTHLANEV